MGWSIGYDNNWGRDIGYGVPATCDHPACGAVINRGLSHVCGAQVLGGADGCGLFFCEKHLQYAGDRRDNVQLCSRCYHGRGGPYEPTPDRPEWIRHKLTDASWQQWRDENTDEVAKLRAEAA